MFSYLEHLQPNYFLLENVRGILAHPLRSSQADAHNLEGGIQNGVVKLLFRLGTALG